MEKETCALCGQAVKLKGFTQTDINGIKKFCCGACLCLFQLINGSKESNPMAKEPDSNNANNNTNNNNTNNKEPYESL